MSEEDSHLFKKYEDKNCLILTRAGLKYKTSDLRVLKDRILFHDKYSNEVLLSLSEIVSILELKEQSND